MIKKILLTGGSGFIGTAVTAEAAKKNIDFHNISNVMGNCKYPDKTTLLPLSDKNGLKKCLNEYKPDAVIHMAAISSFVHENRSEVYDVNVCGTENLLDAIKQTCNNGVRVLLFSSAMVYGNRDIEFFKETDGFNPNNHYSCSKVNMEFISRNYADCMDIRIVRPFNIIGPGQSGGFVVPKLINAFNERLREIKLGNLYPVRDYVDVEYAAETVIRFLSLDALEYSVLNICSGIGHSLQDVIDMLIRITNFEPLINISEEYKRPDEINRMVGSNERIKEVMSLKLPDLLEIVLKRMLKGARHEL